MTEQLFDIAKYNSLVEHIEPIKFIGEVTRVVGITIECKGPQAVIGEVCKILLSDKYLRFL